IVSSVLFLLHYYIWARLIRDTGLADPLRASLTVALFLLGFMIPLGMIFNRLAPRALTTPFMWIIYTWLGMAFLLNVLLAVTDLARLLAVALPLRLQGQSLNPERRLFLAKMVGLGVVAANLGMSLVGFLGASASAIQVKRLKVALTGLPQSLEGFRMVQITDIHVGPTIGRHFIETIVKEVNALQPDLVAITGDLMDGTLAQLMDGVEPLKQLAAKEGVYFVTGNHEYYTGDVDEWLAWLSSIGIRPLRNERVTIRQGF